MDELVKDEHYEWIFAIGINDPSVDEIRYSIELYYLENDTKEVIAAESDCFININSEIVDGPANYNGNQYVRDVQNDDNGDSEDNEEVIDQNNDNNNGNGDDSDIPDLISENYILFIILISLVILVLIMVVLIKKSSKVKTFIYQHINIDKSQTTNIDKSKDDHRIMIKVTTEKKEKGVDEY